MKNTCGLCGFGLWPLPSGVKICRRCDTSIHNNGMRVGPPNTPSTDNGWFNPGFGDRA